MKNKKHCTHFNAVKWQIKYNFGYKHMYKQCMKCTKIFENKNKKEIPEEIRELNKNMRKAIRERLEK